MALEAIARGLAIAEEIGDPRLKSWGVVPRPVPGDEREHGGGIADAPGGLELSPDPLNTAWANGWLGFAYREHGDYDRAIAYLERAIASLHEYAYPRLLSWYEGWLSEAHLRRGDPERARDRPCTPSPSPGRRGCQWAGAQRALGRIALAAGAFSEATERLLEALETFAAIGARFEEASTRLDLAACAGRQDEGERAAAHLAEALALFNRLPAPMYRERAERLASELGAPTAWGTITAAEGAVLPPAGRDAT